MTVSIVILFIEFFLLCFSIIDYRNNDKVKLYISYVIIFILTILSGMRYNVGADFMNYERMYLYPNDINNKFIEEIWIIYAQILRKIGASSFFWFLSTSFIINCSIVTTLRKLSKNFYISVAFYLAIPQLFFESLNIVRQFVALAIIFRFSDLFFQRKYIKFLLVIFIASFFHESAILLVPIFAVSLISIPNIILIIIIFACFLLRNSFLNYIILIISKISSYDGYVNNLIQSSSNSGIYAYVLLFICLFICLFFSKNTTGKLNVLKNLSLMSFCIYLLFYTFQPGQRIGFYLLPYFLLLIPYIRTKKNLYINFLMLGSIFVLFIMFTLKSGLSQIYLTRFL